MRSLAAIGADECIQLTADDKTLTAQFSAVSAADRCGHRLSVGTQRGIIIAGLAKYTPAGSPGALCAGGSWHGADIALNGAVLRSAPLLLMGSGIGSLTIAAAGGDRRNAAGGGAGEIDHRHHPRRLQEIAAAWPQDDSQKRTVFTSDKKIASAQKMGLIS